MAIKDLSNQVSIVQPLSPRTNAAAGSGSTVDLAGYNAATVVVASGVTAGGILSASVLESADGVAWSVPAASDLTASGQITHTSQSAVTAVGYLGTKRYLTVITSATAAASNSQSYVASVIKSSPRHRP